MQHATYLDKLIDAGFVYAGRWTKQEFNLELDLGKPGIYALVENDEIKFIGKTERDLDVRLHSHRRRAEDAETNKRKPLHYRLAETIYGNRAVEIYVLLCADQVTMWRGLPVDVLSGLEAALIRQLDPPYNRADRVNPRVRLAA